MATWNDLKRYVHRNYTVQIDDDDSMTMMYATVEDRSQIVMLSRQSLMDEEWVDIESPIALANDVDAARALHEAGKLVCGGLVINGDMLMLRHSAPLANLDTNEFEQPFAAVTFTADMLEQELTGRDEF